MTFRDERDAQRHRVEALERDVESLRAELVTVSDARDRAVAELERIRDDPESRHTDTRFVPGARVSVEWRGSWWNATVVAVVAPNLWLVHYDGWSSRWDETVGPSRIVPRTTTPPGPRGRTSPSLLLFIALFLAVGAALGFGVFVSSAPAPLATPDLPGTAISSATTLTAGALVWVEWNGVWYRAVVIEPSVPGGTLIHYEGYADTFDETVPPQRIRQR